MSATEITAKMNYRPGQGLWFTTAREMQVDDSVLYILAHAGGNAEDYFRWQSDLPDDLLMKAVTLPGTGHRYNEAYLTDIDLLIENITAAIEQEDDKEFYIFGHSMGAILAWEVAKKLRKPPSGLLISASLSPTEIPSTRITRMSEMDNETFIKEMAYFNGIDKDFARNSFVNSIIAERLKRDFKLIAGYQYQYTDPISTPIMVIVGEHDAHVSASNLIKWQSHTQNFFGIKKVPGNHFYFNDYPETLVDAISEMIQASQKHNTKYTIII